jgi:hypothetical protein
MSIMSIPATIVETSTLLKKSGTVVLDGNGNGVLIFDPDNARQRWEVTSVVVSTNQAAIAGMVPVVTLAVNTVALSTMSPSNQRGASWNGNQDTFSGQIDIGPCDFLSIIFAPPTGSVGTPLAGVLATAIVTGTKYTRRG